MIARNDILSVGTTQKPYGIRGEIVVRFRNAAYADVDADYYFLEIEGIPVPFFCGRVYLFWRSVGASEI